MLNKKNWILYALVTTLFWGIWGALISKPEEAGFPATLSYVVWSFTMIIPALFALKNINWKIEKSPKAIMMGLLIGFTGAGGQLLLFTGAIANGPAYLIFPIISLSPVITILLSMALLKERTDLKGWIGILLALIAIPLLSYSESTGNAHGSAWFIFALLVFIAWGVQGYFFKSANEIMKAESIFFYMTITGLLLAPVAYFMTDFSKEINYGMEGPGYAFMIQILNSIGALTIVYAFRYGKAMIVSPMTNAVAPVITIVLSLIMYAVFPASYALIGMVLAVISAFVLAFE